MNNRDRETWERFAAAAVCGYYADQAATYALTDEWIVKEADRFLALTKERWPGKTCSPRCNSVTPAPAGDETVTEPDPGEGYRWVERGETLREGDELKSRADEWWKTLSAGRLCTCHHTYRRRIDAAPEPSSGACQLPAETTPRADEVRSEVRSTGGGGVEEPLTVAWGVRRVGGAYVSIHGSENEAVASQRHFSAVENFPYVVRPLVRRTDAERLIAAARREAEEARAECERLRATDAEIQALRDTEAEWRYRVVQRLCHRGGAVAVADALRGLRERHTNGGAA